MTLAATQPAFSSAYCSTIPFWCSAFV